MKTEKYNWKALTFRASSIGDALMAKYLLEQMRAAHPEGRFALVVAGRGKMIRDLLQAYPWIEVIEANRKTPKAVLKLVKDFWLSDVVVTPYTAGTVNFFTKLMARFLAKGSGAIGFLDKSRWSKYFFDVQLPFWGRGVAPRLLEQAALQAAGVPVKDTWMTFARIPQPHLLSQLNLQKGGYIVVHLFAGSQTRGLDPEHQQTLIDELVRQFPGTALVFSGTAHDHGFIQKLRLPHNTVMPSTSVQELAELIANSKGVVSVGTGPSHMASIMRHPTVVMCVCHGVPWCGKEQYGDAPIAVFARPELCPNGHNGEGYARCMNGIDMAAVATKAKQLFAGA